MKRITVRCFVAITIVLALLAGFTMTAYAEASASEVQLSFWTHSSSVKEWVDANSEGFNVEVVAVPGNEYERKLKIAIAGGEAPDIVGMDQPNISSYADGGALAPLDSFWDEADRARYPEHQIAACSYDGSIYAIPNREDNRVLIYNVKLMEEAGITPPKTVEDAWTFDEFLEVAEKLTKKNGDVTEVYGVLPCQGPPDQANEGRTYDFLLYMRSAGGDMVAPDLSTATGYLDSAESKKAFQLFYDLHDKGYAPRQDVPDGFGTGKIAMMLAGPRFISGLSNFDIEYDYTPIPKEQKYVSGTGSWWLSITSQSKNKEAAWALLQHLTEDSTLIKLNELELSLPTKSGLETEAMRNNPVVRFLFETSQEYGIPRPITPIYPQISELYTQAINAVCFGEPVDDVVEMFTKDINKVLS